MPGISMFSWYLWVQRKPIVSMRQPSPTLQQCACSECWYTATSTNHHPLLTELSLHRKLLLIDFYKYFQCHFNISTFLGQVFQEAPFTKPGQSYKICRFTPSLRSKVHNQSALIICRYTQFCLCEHSLGFEGKPENKASWWAFYLPSHLIAISQVFCTWYTSHPCSICRRSSMCLWWRIWECGPWC